MASTAPGIMTSFKGKKYMGGQGENLPPPTTLLKENKASFSTSLSTLALSLIGQNGVTGCPNTQSL